MFKIFLLGLAVVSFSVHAQDKQAECQALKVRIQQLDQQARQPQSGPSQDRITAEKQKARTRQWDLKCQ